MDPVQTTKAFNTCRLSGNRRADFHRTFSTPYLCLTDKTEIILTTMQIVANQLEVIIDKYAAALRSLPEKEMALKPSPVKWSKKEIIGHLIDSAESNIRRFVVAQYEEAPTINYNQDKWVAIVNYQHWNNADLINLWYLLNKQVVAILKNTPPDKALRKCQTQELYSLEWLATDYIKHLTHHIHQVLEWEPVAYP